jgi:hypothetical protein
MKRSWFVGLAVVLGCAAVLVPVKVAPPLLTADAHASDWTCSRSALVVVTCAPRHQRGFVSTD